MGVSGSGKTTVGTLLAQTLGWQFADGDDFHPQSNIDKMSHGIPLTDEDRQPWLDALRAAICNWLSDQRRVVVACSALKHEYRDVLRVDSDRVQFVYLKASFDELERRLKKRKHHFMKSDLLTSQLSTLEEPEHALEVDADKTPPKIVAEVIAALGLSSAQI